MLHEPNTRVIYKISQGMTCHTHLFVNLDINCTIGFPNFSLIYLILYCPATRAICRYCPVMRVTYRYCPEGGSALVVSLLCTPLALWPVQPLGFRCMYQANYLCPIVSLTIKFTAKGCLNVYSLYCVL